MSRCENYKNCGKQANPDSTFCAECKAAALARVLAMNVSPRNTAGLKWALNGVRR